MIGPDKATAASQDVRETTASHFMHEHVFLRSTIRLVLE
jgi:hypothetical protein